MAQNLAPHTVTESNTRALNPRRVHRIRIVLTTVILLAAALIIPFRIHVNRTQVMAAMSRALGRDVSFSSIHYRLLPWPGFSITGFTVAEDPAFSPEPVIHAENVTADIRISSLWRGRLEISRIRLEEPSLNIVRNAEGRWNLEAILLRAAQIPTAPTNRRIAEQRARFPYIEASGGRINLRFGNEKKPFTLMESDFVLWLGAENRWNFEFTAHPTRTDMNLTDLGIVRGNGIIQRAGSLNTTPLNLHLAWDYAQLGQATKLILGEDKGWRGGITFSADLGGTPNDLAFTLRLALNGFRRADIMLANPLIIGAQCTGHAHYDAAAVSPLNCTLPLETGLLALRGSISNLHDHPRPDLRFTVESVPATALLAVLRRVKQSIPDDLRVRGTLDAAFTTTDAQSSAGRLPDSSSTVPRVWKGNGILAGFELASGELAPPLMIGDIHFEKGLEQEPVPSLRKDKKKQPLPTATPYSPDTLHISPVSIDLGGTTPARVGGEASSRNFALHLQGPAQLTRLLALGTALGLRPIRTNAEGMLQTDLSLIGAWRQSAAPAVTGVAAIERLRWQGRQLNAPVALTNGVILLTADSARITNLIVETGKNLTLHGDFGFQRGCSPITECNFRFQFATPSLSADALNQLLNPATQTQGFRFFASAPQPFAWQWLHAQGSLALDQVQLGRLALSHCSSFVTIAATAVSLQNLHCQALRGEHTGQWSLDFSGDQPKFTGQGKLVRASIADAANLFHEDWGAGSADIEYNLRFFGRHVPQFASSTEGSIKASIQNGLWKHGRTPDGHTLQFRSWQLSAQISGGSMKIAEGLLQLPQRAFTTNGTIGLDRSLNLDFVPGSAGKNVAAFHAEGTVQDPAISVVMDTKAGAQVHQREKITAKK